MIGPNVVFGPEVTVESGATILAFCHLEGCHVSRGARIGPFARLRPGAEIAEDVAHRQLRRDQERHRRGRRQGQPPRATSATPRSARGANIGAGTITCNYDGVFKHRTEIGAARLHRLEHARWSRRSASATARWSPPGSVDHRGRARRRARASPAAGRRSSPASAQQAHGAAAGAQGREGRRLMCGIVGILGRHEVAPLILEALKRLEYRGYDSAGIATLQDGRLARRRAVGKLIALSDLLVRDPIRGQAGIGHTRWATHGAPTERNAHPHHAGRVAVVHNGIIENFRALRAELEAEGAVFETETDTEAIAQLCDRELGARQHAARGRPRHAGAARGAFALCFLFEGEDGPADRRPPRLAARDRLRRRRDVRRLGRAGARAVDQPRSPISRRATTRCSPATAVAIFDAAGSPVDARGRAPSPLENVYAEKGPYKHFMAKEMHEQPTVLADALAPLPDRRTARAVRRRRPSTSPRCDRLVLVACGTAHYACHVARYWFEALARLPVEIEVASEFRYREPPLDARHASASSSASRARPPTRWRRCATSGRRAARPSRSSTSRPRRSRARATWRCRSSPAPRSASPRPRPSPASSRCSRRWRSRPAGQRGALDAAEEARLVAALAAVPGLRRAGAGARARDRRDRRASSPRARRALPRPRARCTRWRSRGR